MLWSPMSVRSSIGRRCATTVISLSTRASRYSFGKDRLSKTATPRIRGLVQPDQTVVHRLDRGGASPMTCFFSSRSSGSLREFSHASRSAFACSLCK